MKKCLLMRMTMQRLLLVFVHLFLLSGCVGMQTEAQKKILLDKECKEVGRALGKESAWASLCTGEDASILYNAKAEMLRKKMLKDNQNILCAIVSFEYGKSTGNLAQEVARERKIDCAHIIAADFRKQYLNAMPENLCLPWYNRNAHPVALEEADKIVKQRSIDCVAVINGIKGTAAIEQQTAEIKEQNRILRGIEKDINRPVNHSVTCSSIGNLVTCN